MVRKSVANPFRFCPGRSRRALMWPAGITNLAARWSAKDSTITTARDGTGSAPADAGLVGRVLDLSGNGYYLTASSDGARMDWYANGMGLGRASIHSHQAAPYSGATEDLFNNTTLANAVFNGTNPSFTVCMLFARWYESGGTNNYIFNVIGNGDTIGGGTGNPTFTIGMNSAVQNATRPLITAGYSRDNDASLAGGQVFDDGVFGLGYGSSSIICLTRVESGTSCKIYQNGHLVSTTTKSSGVYTFASGDYVSLMKAFNGTTRTGALDGHLYEACIFGKALSDAERQAVEAYYLGLLGVQYSAATVTTPKKLWFFGHSMFIGNVATTACPPYLIARGGFLPWDYKIAIANESTGGQHFTNAGADNDLHECVAYKLTTASTIKDGDIAIIRGLTNDMPEYNSTNGAVEAGLDGEVANFKADVEALLDGGALVVHIADPPLGSGGNAVSQHGLAYWRDIIRPVLGRYDRVEFADSYARLISGGELPAIYDSGDSVHMTRAGYDIETQEIAAAIHRLIDVNPATHANLIRWYSGREQTRTLADAAAMATINDLSATGDDAAQATAGNKPTFRLGTSTSNYKATIRFDAVDDFATFTAVDLAAWTLIVAVSTSAADARILHDEAVGNGYLRLTDTTTTRVRAGAGNVVRFTHAARTDYDVLVIRSDTRMWINGTAATVDAAEGSAFSANFAADQLGRSANPFAGELGDVLIYNAALSTADVNAQAKYIADKYAKTWVTVT